MLQWFKHHFRSLILFFGGSVADIRHYDIITVYLELKSRLQADEFSDEIGHAYLATVYRTAFHPHQTAALAEYSRIVLIHPFRYHAVLFLAKAGQMPVCSVMNFCHLLRLLQKAFAFRRKNAGAVRLFQDVDYISVIRESPVRPGAMASVMTDVHRFIPLRSRCYLHFLEFIRMGVHPRPVRIFPEHLYRLQLQQCDKQ